MKKHFLFLLITILSLNCYAQIDFKKGYYVDNTNQKIDCLINSVDWNNNPSEFEYKLSENGESKKATIKNVQEFGIDNVAKYIRSKVNIDRSSEVVTKLSQVRNPLYKEEELFLKVLIEGASNLYEYTDVSLVRYFYNLESSNIEQLIYKSYNTKENKIAENNGFRQQILNNLKCPDITASTISKVDYNKSDLTKLFAKYSDCQNSEIHYLELKKNRDFFNLTIRPRFSSSSFMIETLSFYPGEAVDFGSKTGFGIGIEAEVILPINKNKWALAVEPTYQSFKAETTNNNVVSVIGGTIASRVDYSVVEVPVSLRHYLYLNENSKFFIDASFVFGFSSNTMLEFENLQTSFTFQKTINDTTNFGFGVGYKFLDTYSLEIRYQTQRDLVGKDASMSSSYKALSVIFGYSLF